MVPITLFFGANSSGKSSIGHFLMMLKQTVESPDRVSITKQGDTYKEFPSHEGLQNFDPSDRKFIAVANAHREKPYILQATDSKWWHKKADLSDAGIKVYFVCPEYIKNKSEKKMG